MPRTYKRKSDAGLVSEEAMREAVKMVIGGGKMRKVAIDKGISRSVLCRYVRKYKQNESCPLTPNYRHRQVFTQDNPEKMIVMFHRHHQDQQRSPVVNVESRC